MIPILLLFLFWKLDSTAAFGCGYPGSHLNSKVVLQFPPLYAGANGGIYPVPDGTVAIYSCEEPYIVLGESRRTCLDTGRWTGNAPLCGLNVAMHKPLILPVDQSAWLTVDGIISTRPRDCYIKDLNAGEILTWKLDLIESYQVYGLRILLHSPAAWVAKVSIQNLEGTENSPEVTCGMIESPGSENVGPVGLTCGKTLAARAVQMDFVPASATRVRICEVNVLAIDATTSDFCPHPASAKGIFNSTCLSFHSHGVTTWNNALQSCRKIGGSLVQNINGEKQLFIQTKLHYLHAKVSSNEAFYWIGLFRSVNFTGIDDQWLWATGQPPEKTFWATSQPDPLSMRQFCAAVGRRSDWLWSDFNCESGTGFWICESAFTSCPIPEQPANGLITALDRRVGGLVNYRCEDGSTMVGSSMRTCLSSGKWSGLVTRCTSPYSAITSHHRTVMTMTTPGPFLPKVTAAKANSATSAVFNYQSTTPLMKVSMQDDDQITTSPSPTVSTVRISTAMTAHTHSEAAASQATTEEDILPTHFIPDPDYFDHETTTENSSNSTKHILTTNRDTSPSTAPWKRNPFETPFFPTVPTTPVETPLFYTLPTEIPRTMTTTATTMTTTVQTSPTTLPTTTNRQEPSTTIPVPVATRTTGFRFPSGIHSRCKKAPALLFGHSTLDMLGMNVVARYSCDSGFNMVGLPLMSCLPDGVWRGIMPLCIPGFGAAATRAPTTIRETSSSRFPTKFVPSTSTSTESSSTSTTTTAPITTVSTTEQTSTVVQTKQTSPESEETTVGEPVWTKEVRKVTTSEQSSTTAEHTTSQEVSQDSAMTTVQTTDLPTTTEPLSTKIRVVSVSDLACSPVPFVSHAEVTFKRNKISFRCLSGYKLVGPNVTVCERTGDWSALPSCIVIECGPPEPPPNGYVSLLNDTTAVGSLAVYSCNNHTSNPLFYRICSETGKWEGNVPECVPELPTIVPSESKLEPNRLSLSGTMTIIIGIVGVITGLLVLVATVFIVRWVRRRDSREVPVAISPSTFIGTLEHSRSTDIMVEPNSMRNVFNRPRYVPSLQTQSAYDTCLASHARSDAHCT